MPSMPRFDGKAVWIIELGTSSETATVTIDRESGDVVEVVIK